MTASPANGHAGRPALAAHASPWRPRPWSGVYPATLCPFHADESIDEEGLVASIADVASVPGIEGVVCNGHTGEIMSLSPAERARVTRCVAAGVAQANVKTGRRVKVISGVSAEGSQEAIDHAIAARAKVRDVLGISAADTGLRVRVLKSQFGDVVSGVWRYMTPDKIQVWARWCYPAVDSTQLKTFVQYQYKGPYSGNSADYTNPANYVVSEESRLYAGYLSGAITFISWLPGQPVGFFYSAPNEQATGFPAPIEPLKAALASLPNFSSRGDSFQGTLSRDAGFKGVQPILGLLRTINQVNQTWYARLKAERLAGQSTTVPAAR